jgi:hypothetical protein
VQTVLYAGNGIGAQLTGGGGPTVEVGGAGGLATLHGGQGRNILIAGAGGANLQGSPGGSILIGGYTDYDQNLSVLEAALAEWNSTDIYGTRLAKLMGSSPYMNPTPFNASTVHSNGHVDQLQGGAGAAAIDWFFASSVDTITGNNPSETITTIL